MATATDTLRSQLAASLSGMDSEAVLDLATAMSIAGQELLEAAGALHLFYRAGSKADAHTLATIRARLASANGAIAAYDRQQVLAKGRAAMAKQEAR